MLSMMMFLLLTCSNPSCSNNETNPLEHINIIRGIMEWYNGCKMDRYISKELDKRLEVYKLSAKNETSKKNRSIIDLAIQDYMSSSVNGRQPSKLDTEFRTSLTRNIRMFLFAGHDSTSSTLCYCYHLLSTNPSALARMRAEHDAILGADPSATASLISNDPSVLNQLPYTNACIKETTRLFPAASSIRQGSPDVNLVDSTGTTYPTANVSVWILHLEIQRSAEYWTRPLAFLPERWLVGPDDPLYPRKGAWRTFEHGPRNCIGQQLVFVELKVILAMTVRLFEVRPAYEEWDALYPAKGKAKGARNVDGERVYQVEEGAAHPVDKYPCRVALRE